MAMTLAAATLVTAICSTAFVANESSDGRMAELMGFGHHHMVDDYATHCPGIGQPMTGGQLQSHAMDRRQCESMMDESGLHAGREG